MVFGWLKPEEEPENGGLVEISDDSGTHIVISTPTTDDALKVEGTVRRGARAKSDRDDSMSNFDARRDYSRRNHDELRVRSGPVAQPNEDREPEEDNDRVREQNEQAASGGWWPF